MKSYKQKKFKPKTFYYSEFVAFIFFLSVCVFCIIDTIVTPEQEFIDFFLNQDLIGGAHQRRNILIEKFIVSHWGKTGMQVTLVIITLLIINELSEAIGAYRRLLFREKLIREGLRAPDDYVDDYVRVPLWKKIVNLFAIKRKKKYPSESEMRESLKKNKYYKE
ncbi:MAG: hypothetical protein J6U04_04175 [Salinivirgaceae bacterium]|nr:hypothetical protein [Salinivirgaceae bacterium]